jgi:hypothetical protein
MLLALFSLHSLSAQTSSSSTCPQGQGFWMNHSASWSVTQLQLGSQVYTQAELIAILNMSPAGDASILVAHQLIAVKLNLANGVDGSAVVAAINEADTLLASFTGKLPFGVQASSEVGQKLVVDASTFDAFNQGLLSTNCSDGDEETPEATPEATNSPTPEVTPESTTTPNLTITIVIEGPVQAININIITIYGINVELKPDDPMLKVIRIGDIVHVEGDTEPGEGNTIVIVAITVVIVNVDVVVNTDGQVWRDSGDCSNGPPPWAPANGWRRRCQPQGGSSSGGGKGMGMGDDD